MHHANARSCPPAWLTAAAFLFLALDAGTVSAAEKAGKWNTRTSDAPIAPPGATPELQPLWMPGPGLAPINNADVQVHPSSNPQTEVHIAVNPANPLNMLITSNTTPTSTGQGYYYTLNGGVTWNGSDAYPNGTTNYGDPVSVFDGIGRAYDVTLNAPGGISYAPSLNGGVTWGAQVQCDPLNSANDDKEMACADQDPASPYANRFYVAWTDFGLSPARLVLTTSGDNFTARKTLDAALAGDLGQGVNLQCGPNGAVYAVWAVYAGGYLPEAGYGFSRSLDGGMTWTPASMVFTCVGIRTSNGANALFNGTRVNGFPSMAVDNSHGPRRGRIYVTYADRSTGDSDIYFRYSDNQGATWSAASRVNTEPVGNGQQQWFPWATCDPISGDLSIAYYDMDQPSGFQTKWWIAHSTDGGATFETFPVSDVHFTPTALPAPFAGGYAGDYYGITSWNGKAFPAWSDNRTGQYNVYFEAVVYADPTDPNAPANLSATSDCTTPTSITLNWTDPTTRVDGTPLGDFEILVYRNGTPIGPVDQGIQTITDTGLTTGLLYNYDLRTHDQNNDSLSIIVSLSKYAGGDPTPAPPSAFTVASSPGPSFSLAWTNPSTNADGSNLCDFGGINVYRNGVVLATLPRAHGDAGAADSFVDNAPLPGLNCYKLTGLDDESPLHESSFSTEVCVEVPLNPPFCDQFPAAGDPDNGKWTTTGVVVDTLGANIPSPPYAADFDGPEYLASRPIDMSAATGLGYVLVYQKEQTGNGESADANNDLILEMLNSTGTWDEITRHLGSDADEVNFTTHVFQLDALTPSAGTYFHSQFKFRFRATSDPGLDNWFVDNVCLDIPNCGPTITVNPASLNDTEVAGTPSGASYPVTVANTCAFNALTWSAVANPPVSWLSLANNSGTISGTGSQVFVAHFNAVGLVPGVYNTLIDVSSNDPLNPIISVTVQLTVTDAPVISLSPASITHTLPNTGPAVSDNVTIANTGTGPLIYSVRDAVAGVSPFSAEFIGILRADGGLEPRSRGSVAPKPNPAKTAWYAAGLGDGQGYRLESSLGTSDYEKDRVKREYKGGADNGVDVHQPPQLFSQGGPDAAGYHYIDSDESGGPHFSFVDISGVGTPSGVTGDDQNGGPFPLGFTFQHYGNTYTSVRICSNGFLSFTSTSTTFTNSALPAAGAPANMIGPYWDDLNPAEAGTIFTYQDVANERFIVQWNNVPHYQVGGGAPPNTFEVIINKNGTILYQYLNIASPANSATVGVQNGNGTIGLQAAYNQSYVHNNLAVLIYQDAAWLSGAPTSGTVNPGDSAILQVTSDPTGLFARTYYGNVLVSSNDPVTPVAPVHVTMEVTADPNIVVNPTAVCDTLVAGTTDAKVVNVSNTAADASLNYNVVETPDVAWLDVTPTSGTIAGVGSNALNVAFDATGQVPGNYTTTVHIVSNDPDNPDVPVAVCLKVTGAPHADITPDSLCTVVGLFDGNPISRAVHVGNTGAVSLDFRVSDTKGIPASPGFLQTADFSAEVVADALAPNPVKLELFKDSADRIVNPGDPNPEAEPEAKGYFSNDRARLQPYGQGGPDSFGYRWIDSDQAGGPSFEWIELQGNGGIDTGLHADDVNLGPFNLGFTMPFYGTNFTSVRVCSNGFISFNSTSTQYSNTALPNTALPNNTIAPLWDDYNMAGGVGTCYYRSDPALGRFIVEWKKVTRYNALSDTLTFEAILSKDGTITYNYLSVKGVLNSNTIGIENSTGTVGLQVVFNANYVHNNLTVVIQPDQPWLSVTPLQGSVAPGGTQLLSVTMNPAGLPIGLHTGWVRILTNDPLLPQKSIKVCFQVSDPTAVVLSKFDAISTPDGVSVTWTTSDETNHAFFDILRGDQLDGPFVRLNTGPIMGNGQYGYTDGAVQDGSTYWYLLEAVDREGSRQQLGPISVTYDGRPAAFNLAQNHPNPFAGRTSFRLDVPAPTSVAVRIYDATGRLVRTFMDGTNVDAGRYNFEWDGLDDHGRQSAAGFYFLKAETSSSSKTVRMLLVK